MAKILVLFLLQTILAFSQTSDEASVRSLVERFFTLHAAEDIQAIMALWSTHSPDRKAFEKELTDLFDKFDFSFSAPRFLRIQIEGDEANLRVSADALVKRIGSPKPYLRTYTRTFVLVKEGDGWKIWRYYPAAQELVNSLAAATDETEVERLLDAERELVNEDLVSLLISMATQHLERNEPKQGLRLAQIAKTIAAQIDDPAGYAFAWYCESDAFWRMGEIDRTIEVKEKCLEWLQDEVERQQGKLPPEKFAWLQEIFFQLLHWTGVFYKFVVGDQSKVLQKYQTMLHYAQRYGDVYAEAYALNSIGGEQVGMGELVQGIQTMERAIELLERLLQQYPANRGLAASYLIFLNHLASAYNGLLIPQRALTLYGKSLSISRELGNKVGEMGALWGIGHSFVLQGNFEKAQTYFEQSLKLAKEEEHYGWVYTNLSSLIEFHRKRGRFDAAMACAEEALKVARYVQSPSWELGALEHLAFLSVQKGDFQRAKAYIDEGLKLAERLNLQPQRIYQALGDMNRKQKQWQEAIDAYRKVIKFFEEKFVTLSEPTGKLISPEREWVKAYNNLAICLLMLGQTEEALKMTERAKARTLAEIMQTGKIDLQKRMTENERRQEEELRKQITRLNIALRSLQNQPNPDQQQVKHLQEQIAEARRTYESFRREIYLNHPDIAVLKVELPPITVKQLTELLPDEKTALLEFVVGDDQSFVFIIVRKNGQPLVTVQPIKVSHEELTKLVKSFRERLAKQSLKFPEATTLYDLLIAPLENVLAGKKVLCIVPDGVLWELPFAALRDKSGKFLIERFAISYAPSLTTLSAMHKYARQRVERRKGQLLAFAYPSFGASRKVELPLRGTFEELPQTEKEAKAIAQLFGRDARVYLREQATESLIKREAPNYRVVHIAAHGIFDPQAPLYSGVLLALEQVEDGILEAWEIADMDLNAELVVLSACETARGLVKEGEGLIGFAWAIFVAGCPSSLLTQWQVADKSTAELMTAFYRNWRSQNISKAEALQRAQLSLLRSNSWAHPFFWSPFVLIGDWR
jgi:CHAT domain-containing protein/ketosteroid isomerase-like protein/Tfp pilus assembly protein PilF